MHDTSNENKEELKGVFEDKDEGVVEEQEPETDVAKEETADAKVFFEEEELESSTTVEEEDEV